MGPERSCSGSLFLTVTGLKWWVADWIKSSLVHTSVQKRQWNPWKENRKTEGWFGHLWNRNKSLKLISITKSVKRCSGFCVDNWGALVKTDYSSFILCINFLVIFETQKTEPQLTGFFPIQRNMLKSSHFQMLSHFSRSSFYEANALTNLAFTC